MRKYVTYRRVSSTEQGKSGLGLEARARDIQLFLDNYAEFPFEVLNESGFTTPRGCKFHRSQVSTILKRTPNPAEALGMAGG